MRYMVLFFVFYSFMALGNQDFVGTLTSTQGHVQLFTNPGKAMSGAPPHVLFEGEYYSIHDAKPGEKVKKGNIVRTSTSAQAKVVYENGDQIHIGSASSYKISWDDAGKKQTLVSLLYGKIRNVVSKEGPRNNMKVRAGGTVMGVRGTDFYVSKKGVSNTVEITTLRGEVAVKQEPTKQEAAKESTKEITKEIAKEIIVKTGFTAKVEDLTVAANAKTSQLKPDAKTELTKTTKEELAVIKTVSAKSIMVKAPESVAASASVTAEIKRLETQAKETTLNDIKTYDPKLYEEIRQKKDLVDIDNINTKVIEKVAVNAPREVKKSKPTRQELEELEKDSYEHYFKNVN